MHTQSGVIRRKVGIDVSGGKRDYFEPTGAALPEPEALPPLSAKPSHDFEALNAAWFSQ